MSELGGQQTSYFKDVSISIRIPKIKCVSKTEMKLNEVLIFLSKSELLGVFLKTRVIACYDLLYDLLFTSFNSGMVTRLAFQIFTIMILSLNSCLKVLGLRKGGGF